MNIIELVGYIPAIIFPAATFVQLLYLLKTKSAQGVSSSTWFAFAIGNLSLYAYTEKYDALQSIFGQLVTSVFQFYIVFLVYKYRRQEKRQAQTITADTVTS
ncbi:MAG: hypothetical protein JKX78_15365 [Alteromonadaceae bacterium]|nr:hypothetical protein [Alteromonadaceae bacterium]